MDPFTIFGPPRITVADMVLSPLAVQAGELTEEEAIDRLMAKMDEPRTSPPGWPYCPASRP